VADNWQLEVSLDDTITDVKQQIFDKYKIPFGDQILFAGSSKTAVQILKDNEKIKDSHIQQNDIIKLKLREKKYPLTIYIQYKAGDLVPIGVSPDETLNEVRERIFDQDVALYDNDGNEITYDASINGNDIKNSDILYSQDEKAKVDIPNQENAVQRREVYADHEQIKRPLTPTEAGSVRPSKYTKKKEFLTL
jgi:hypothetical protein